MAFKRIIATLLVKDGQVVKSYGYRSWRPAGRLVSALRNLDRWLVDEILILDISRRDSVNPDVLRTITESAISTPLIYGGGIRTESDVSRLLEAGCDRIVLETLLLRQPETVHQFADIVGSQALIGCLPLVSDERGVRLWNPEAATTRHQELPDLIAHCQNLPVSELMVVDSRNEGYLGKSCRSLHTGVIESSLTKGIIWFGGLDHKLAAELLSSPCTVAVAFGNINFEGELQIPQLRKAILSGEHNSLRRTRIGREQ
jgi:cyclase